MQKNKMETTSSILEHMRLQEGKLFQNEQILALYLDVKAVLYDHMIKKYGKLSEFQILDSSDEIVEALETSLHTLGPQGVSDYHNKALYECVRITSKLLWPSELLLVARPKVGTLLRGCLKRLSVTTGPSFTSFDPIQQDFVIREAFRRTIINECLVIFEQPNGIAQDDRNELERLDDTVGPDDSASMIGESLNNIITERPAGAHSRLGPIPEHEAASVVSKVEGSPHGAPSVISVAKSPSKQEESAHDDDKKSVAHSVAPRVISNSDSKSKVSHISQASGTSSVLRKPMNVRKVHLEPETNP